MKRRCFRPSSIDAACASYGREIVLLIGALLVGVTARLSPNGPDILDGVAIVAGAILAVGQFTLMGILLLLFFLDRAVHVQENWHSRKLDGIAEIARCKRRLGEGESVD